jgi:hypothetical protein
VEETGVVGMRYPLDSDPPDPVDHSVESRHFATCRQLAPSSSPPAHREPLRVYRARFFAFSSIFTRRRMISGRPPPDREASQSRRVRSAAFFNAGFGPIRIPVQFLGRR